MLNSRSLEHIVNSFEQQNIPSYVVVATLYNELKATRHTAIQLSICSKNARAITARAGDWGKSFSGVSSFIDESAAEMITLADQIGKLARRMTQESVTVLFENQLTEKLQRVAEDNLRKSTLLSDLQKRTGQTTMAFRQQHDRDLRKLKRCLEAINDSKRTLKAIVEICRTEASQAGPFEASLWMIAEAINAAVEDLESQLAMGDKLMNLMANSGVSR